MVECGRKNASCFSCVGGLRAPFCPQSRCLHEASSASTAAMSTPWRGGLCYRDVTSPINRQDVESSSSSSRGALPQPAGRGRLLLRSGLGPGSLSRSKGFGADRSHPLEWRVLRYLSVLAPPALRDAWVYPSKADRPCCAWRARSPSSQHGGREGRGLGWAGCCHGQAWSGTLVSLRRRAGLLCQPWGCTGAAAARLAGPRDSAAKASLESCLR